MEQEKRVIHIPVMLKEVLDYIVPEKGKCRVVDGTLGFGGHSVEILKKNPDLELLGLDRDRYAIESSSNLLRKEIDEGRVKIVRSKFSDLAEVVCKIGWEKVDAILLDIGVSSFQIDEGFRGFSFRMNGPLDMRMDLDQKETASHLLNRLSEEELADIFRKYGEIESSRRLSRAIVERRKTKLWASTQEFSELCENTIPNKRKSGPSVSTLCFQALRIAVNKELEELEKALISAISILNNGGRICVISYHSLEDRIVKNIFRRESTDCLCEVKLPICICNHKASLKQITKKALLPNDEEIVINRRSSSAKFRVAEKIT